MKLALMTYRQKNTYLISGSIFFLAIVYFFGINKTIALYSENKNLKEKIVATNNLSSLENKNSELSLKIGNYNSQEDSSSVYLIGKISEASARHNLMLREFPRVEEGQYQSFIIETQKVTLDGSFHDLLQFLYELEHIQIGRVSSAFILSSHKDNKKKSPGRSLTLFIQNVKEKTL
jgi:hypothetical protein